MKKVLNGQMLHLKNSAVVDQHDDVLVVSLSDQEQALEGEIEKGNLQDYMEIYGLDDDN